MTTTAQEFFQNTDINGALSPDQAAQLMALAESGDTSALLDDGGAPATTTDAEAVTGDPATTDENTSNSTAQAPAAAPAAAAAEIDHSKAVVLAKDGVHTIPYEKLEQARQGEQRWREQAEAAQQQLAELQAQAQQRADSGQSPTKTDAMAAAAEAAIKAGVDPSMFGSFSEEDLAAGIDNVVDMRVDAKLKAALAPFEQMLNQQKQEQAKSDNDRHYDAIFARHPDASSIAQSVEMDAWIKSHPSYAQPALQAVLEHGSTPQVIELFDNFKKATGTAAPTPAADHRQAARAAIEKTQPAVPASLSDIPGGRADGLSAFERLSSMEPAAMTDAMQGMTPEQIEAFLNRNL